MEKINSKQEDLIEKMEFFISEIKKFILDNNILLPENLKENELFNSDFSKKFKNDNKNDDNEKNYNYIDRKKYIPYEMEKNHFNKKNEFDNYPLIMLNSDEKIKELKKILKE